MTAQILDGKKIASALLNDMQQRVVRSAARPPGLAVILVGDDPASEVYVRHKCLACEQVGIRSISRHLHKQITQEELVHLIDTLNADNHVDGILVQLPLPSHIDTQVILDRILPQKDVDGFHPYNLGRLAQKHPTMRPCTPYGIITLLEHFGIQMAGMDTVVVGASTNVGRPMALELLMAKCTVTVCHSLTKDLASHVRRAELLITAMGKPHIIQSEWIKPGAIVVDVGIHRTAENKLIGDIDFETAKNKASWITPVPGGVGPMTVAILLQNTLYAAENLKAISPNSS